MGDALQLQYIIIFLGTPEKDIIQKIVSQLSDSASISVQHEYYLFSEKQ